MTAALRSLVYYPGHLGRDAVTPIPRRSAKIVWDRPVRRVPEPEATSLVERGGFFRALERDEARARFGLSDAALDDLLAAGALRLAPFVDREETRFVVVLDRPTLAALTTRSTSETAAAPAAPLER